MPHAEQICYLRDAELHKQGEALGLSEEEMAFYDALTKPEAIKDFYSNDELVALTRELTEQLRKNRTIDWQQKESARAAMRVMVKRLLKKYKYPPEGMDDAISTVMSQCEMWTDNDISLKEEPVFYPMETHEKEMTHLIAAEPDSISDYAKGRETT